MSGAEELKIRNLCIFQRKKFSIPLNYLIINIINEMTQPWHHYSLFLIIKKEKSVINKQYSTSKNQFILEIFSYFDKSLTKMISRNYLSCLLLDSIQKIIPCKNKSN